jgi:hypothetical protein
MCRKKKNINSAKRRKYFDSYLSVVLTEDCDETFPHPVCILCNEVLQNSSMAPSEVKNKHHFETKHSEHKGKHLSFFPMYVEQPIINESIYAHRIQI